VLVFLFEPTKIVRSAIGVAEVFPVGLWDVVEAHSGLFCTSWSEACETHGRSVECVTIRIYRAER